MPDMSLIASLEMAKATHTGMVRSHNEDSIAADPDIGLATLADGMGGYNAGEVASGIAVAMVPTEMRKLVSSQAHISFGSTTNRVGRRIFGQKGPTLRRSARIFQRRFHPDSSTIGLAWASSLT